MRRPNYSNGSMDDLKYQRPLAAQEAFKMFCGMISKTLEMKLIEKKEAEKKIAKFYKQCDLD